jgi:hypothetical protein
MLMGIKDDQFQVLKKHEKPILGSILQPLKEIPITSENLNVLKCYCTLVRNFTGTALRKMIQRTEHFNGLHLEAFKRFWSALRLIQILEPQMKTYCYLMLRNGWDIEWQLQYADTIEFLSGSFRFHKGLIVKTDFKKGNGLYSIYEVIKEVEKQYWIPLTVFPRYAYRKPGKFSLSFMSVKLKEDRLKSFEILVYNYIKSLGIKELFVPPMEICVKASSSRYNDCGTVRKDYEKPQSSVDCGFLLQSFNPRPLATREVWLPDFSTKINNSFWMIVGRQILKSDPTYPNEDPQVTWELIKTKLKRFFYFDISGFGLQFPRELLLVVSQVIARLYPSVDMFEQQNILQHIMSNVTVQVPGVGFKYPPRGIGLGYYEDLKTICINAILADLDLISVYGDQALISFEDGNRSIFLLNQHDFYMKPGKHRNQAGFIRWSGWTMSPDFCERPKLYFEPLVSLFNGQFHWERKQILRSFFSEYPVLYDKWDCKLPFQYELFFGYEFTKGDSLWNFDNSGVSSKTFKRTGLLKSWAIERLHAPHDEIVDSFVYESPFFTKWKEGDAKAFSLKRKTIYQQSMPARTEIVEYCNPLIVMNKTNKPSLSHIAKCVSDFVESKLVVNYGLTTGKLTYGLNLEDLCKSLRYCALARNPFEAYATGGYSVSTVWRGRSRVSSEWLELVEDLVTKLDYIGLYNISFLDSYEVVQNQPFKYIEGNVSERAVKRKLRTFKAEASSDSLSTKDEVKRIKLDSTNFIDIVEDLTREDILISGAVSIRDDIKGRQNLVDPEVSDAQSEDEDFFLGEYESEEEL